MTNNNIHETQQSISVFFPCYNEQDNVAETVKKAKDLLEQLNTEYEIIIINDGSKDRTGQIAENLANADSCIKVINHPSNQGYGAALQSGFRAAEKELVFYTDGDGQFDISEMTDLIPLMKDYDAVTCYRKNRQEGMIRKINAWCWTKLVCTMFGMNIRDIDCAFKLFKRSIFDEIEMESTGALIDAEILARITMKGYKITQRPVTHLPRQAGVQTGAKLSVILRAFKELFLLRKKIKQ